MVHKLHGPHTALWLSGEVTIPWSVYTHCGRSTFVTTAAVSDYTYMYLSEFKREQTPWGAMNWFCAELMQHQLLRFGCWSTGTHNSEQKSLRVEWATLEFVPKSFINSPSLRKEHKNQLMSEGRNFKSVGTLIRGFTAYVRMITHVYTSGDIDYLS